MTLPQDMQAAVTEFDEWLDAIFAEYPMGQAQWKTIRAHLLSQDAEIDRLHSGVAKHVNRVCELQSRLAVADALLRESLPPAHFVPCLPDSLVYRIQSHLLGASHG